MSTNIEDAFNDPAEFDKSIEGWGQENSQKDLEGNFGSKIFEQNHQQQDPLSHDNQNQMEFHDPLYSPLDDAIREINQKSEIKKAEKLKKAEKQKQKEAKRNKKIAIKRMKALQKAKAKAMQKNQTKSHSRGR
ncbi:hypothetical protein RZR97_02715 [Hydrogenimonas thermophila]|uniref:hypothetical protein n=1 Tax=Hydrogenimonas thermophila TaxID=223786 RepID=UPI00293712CE|nr:hypothetical protein [Hydrogenimonas thermophila]WOE70492.1 hypothetical protein RZR91_02730 [Hydrogenimonas thermophila]WOE73009.1 hypothetical protein RZR97_02715 [Hydrogenimonas thermophila]